MLLPVVISGGYGERLWPVSRAEFPKPFIKMQDGQSLIQKAFLRAAAQADVTEIITVTNSDYYFKTMNEYSTVNGNGIMTRFILEPAPRNTAPAIAMAAFYASAVYDEDIMLLVLPADQLIENNAAFTRAIAEAKLLAEKNHLVTFGITPTGPEIGYGYIERGKGDSVNSFIEKPDSATAATYINNGSYLWNSGIFCFKAGVFLRELELHCPEMAQLAKSAIPADWTQATYNYVELEEKTFSAIPNISIDHAVMEKSKNIVVVACDIGWNDVGSWSAMSDMVDADGSGNRLVGTIYTHNSSNCYIQSDERVIAAVGVSDLIIIDTPDALLVTDRKQAQHVKQIVRQLKDHCHPSSKEHRIVYRSWGSYTILEESVGFKIKRIEVLPKQKLSLQTHKHRSEHWVVVSGKATVQNDGEIFELLPSQSTYIRAGCKHCLQNNGNEMLVIIEVQCGAYLGEDDIVRFSENYERKIEVA